MSQYEEVKKFLAGFDIKFYQKMCCTLWQMFLGTLAFAAGQAWITGTFVDGDGPFALYFSGVIVVFVVIDLMLRAKIRKEKKNEITS